MIRHEMTNHRFGSSMKSNCVIGPPSERSERPGGRFLWVEGPEVGGLVPLSEHVSDFSSTTRSAA